MDAVDEGMKAGNWMSINSKWPSSNPGLQACSSCSHGSFLLMFTALEMKTESVKTGVGSHSLLQGVLLTQRSNPGLGHCRRILYHLSRQESPLEILVETVKKIVRNSL